jgi:Kef-type K+ transport system membrane component KefB
VTLQTLALIGVIALLGPLLAIPEKLHVPVVVGELVAGIVFGSTGFRLLHAGDKTFTYLADVGFALVMFVAGSKVPIRDPHLRGALRPGLLRAVAVGAAAAVFGVTISHAFGIGHAPMYAVLMASSSAALVLPIVDSVRLSGPAVLQLLPQVAIADAACIVALPLAINPHQAVRTGLGALAVLAAAAVLFIALQYLEQRGYRQRLHKLSEERKFALELRLSLIILTALAALAVRTHVSIMLAGFSFGLALAGIGEPRRLARQLFALTDGFLGPLFFVWIGAGLDLRQLGDHPKFIALGMALGFGAVVAHVLMRLTGQPVAMGALAAAQLGVPVAAVTVGGQLNLLQAGEPAALLLGALATIVVATVAAGMHARSATPVTPQAA